LPGCPAKDVETSIVVDRCSRSQRSALLAWQSGCRENFLKITTNGSFKNDVTKGSFKNDVTKGSFKYDVINLLQAPFCQFPLAQIVNRRTLLFKKGCSYVKG